MKQPQSLKQLLTSHIRSDEPTRKSTYSFTMKFGETKIQTDLDVN
jgi:hypothetical protein